MTGTAPHQEDEISIVHLVRFFMDYWIVLLAACVIGTVLGIAASFLMPTKYEAKVVVSYRSQEPGNSLGGLSAAAAQLGFAGMSQGESKRSEALATLQSKSFILDFVREQGIKGKLFPDIWDEDSNQWLEPEPTDNSAYKVFSGRVLSLDDDTAKNITEINILARDPAEAADWANELVSMANDRLRQEAVDEAQRAIDFLNERMTSSNVAEVRETLAQLLRKNIETAMLANIRPDYAFKVIDPAVPADITSPASPNRIMFAAAGFLLGAMVAFLALLMRRLILSAKAARREGHI